MIKRFWMGILTILCSIGITIAISYAWFVNGYDVDPLATGSSKDAYYYSGDGSSEKPFIITNARHLYNLAWLQYLGYYNKPSEVTGGKYKTYYFQLGIDADHPVTLDMKNWPLPPIGTTKYPFIGNFNGNGSTITDLVTTNSFQEFGTKHPSTVTSIQDCNVIGFFGSVGAFDQTVINGTVQTETNSVGDDNEITSFYLNNSSVHTKTSSTCIGAVAGYVNATIEDVGVIQPHLNIKDANGETDVSAISNESEISISSKTSSNLSDFAVVGYAEANYKTQKTKNSTIIYNPTYNYSHFNFKGMGNQSDWGGSMNFEDVYTRFRLNNSPKSQGTNFNYVYQEIRQSNGGILQTQQSSTAYDNVNDWFDDETFTPSKYYNTLKPENGEYLSWYRHDTGSTTEEKRYNYVIALSKDVYTITTTGGVKTGYKIHDENGNYMTINSSNQLVNTTEEDEAVIWLCEGNKLYTYNQMVYSTTIKYYLSGTTTLTTSLQTNSPSINWYWDSNYKTFYYDYSSVRYYLKYYDGSWCVTPLYKITDGNGNYLKMNSTTDNRPVTNATTEAEATVWEFSTNGTNPSGTIKTISGATTRYLRLYNGNLVTSSSSTTSWSNSGSGLSYNSNYIQFRNGNWVAMTNPAYKIGYNTNYLKKDGTNTNSDDAALWTFGNNLTTSGGNGTISILLDGTTKYLTNNNGNLTVSTTATTWYNDGGNLLYSSYNNQKYYLVYDNGWKLDVMDYYIKDSSSNYLTFNDSTSIKNATSATTLWHFSNAGGTYPVGSMSCTNGGTTYYLNKNGNNLELSTNSTTTWANDGDGLYCTDNSKYYLVYDGTWKLVSYTYKIKSGTDYLSLDGSNNIIRTDEASATEWTFSNSGANPSGTISSNGRYLYLDGNGILTTTTTAGNALLFNNTGFGLYDSNNNYIQYYNQKWVCGKAFYIKYGNTYMSYNLGTTSNWKWFYYSNATDPQGVIYTVNNGTVYYLYSNNGTLTCDSNVNNKTNWSRDTYGLNTDYNGTKYIQYDSGWKLAAVKSRPGYYLKSNNYYLVYNGTNVTRSSTADTAWEFTNTGNNPSGYMWTYYNGTRYYLQINNGSLSVSTTQTNSLTNDNGKLYYTVSGDWYDTYNMIRYSNNNFTGYNDWRTKNACTFTFPQTTINDYDNTYFGQTTSVSTNNIISTTTSTSTNRNTYVNEAYNSLTFTSVANISSLANHTITLNSNILETHDLVSTKTTETSEFSYIPLNCKYDANKNITQDVDTSNTGYIVGGSYYTGTPKGDYRVSEYGITNISSSYDYESNAWKKTNGYDNILTVGTNGYGTSKYIGSTYYPESNYEKYASSKSQLLETLKDSSNVYGLHFMSASININHTVSAPKVLINGDYYTDYELPEDSIDFNLASKGYINFFAGTYFKNNDSFFSLHQIERDSNNNIVAIKHISKIYKANSTFGDGYKSQDFIYQYSDSSWSSGNGTPGSTYSLAFDKSWIENPENVSGAGGDLYTKFPKYLWYFEIPVNKGEYALGSVDGGTGAYLIYLDIGANAAPVDRTEIRQQTAYTQETLVYANGIQVLATGSTFSSDSNSAVAIITATNVATAAGNDITITRTTDTISFNIALDSTYYDPGIVLSNGTLSPIASSSRVSNVLKYVDYNRTTDKLYYTTIYNNGTSNTSYDCYEMDKTTGAVIQQITTTGDDAPWGLLKIVSGSGVETTVTDSYFNFPANQMGTTKILDYYSVILTSGLTDYSDTNTMRVVADAIVQAPTDGEYVFEHSYSITGNDITMTPDGLVVYVGPVLKANASISEPTSNVVTVTTEVNNVTYTFTFNADARNLTAKTVTIYYETPETP